MCLIVEVDGYVAHAGREAFEADRVRDTALKLLGYEIVRFTWRRLINSPAEVAAALRELLARMVDGSASARRPQVASRHGCRACPREAGRGADPDRAGARGTRAA